MIEMWDETFSLLDDRVSGFIARGDGDAAFLAMHEQLDTVWGEAHRLLRPGGIACINVGDATRKIGGSFRVFPNHARVIVDCLGLGFEPLPEVVWRKESNKPTKFMGSGMLPGAAYVTQEHEYILILRKRRAREAPSARRSLARRESAFFWEERNVWFSDVWKDLRGERQALRLKDLRGRSASYPFELAYRLISMFSVQGELVLDPFLGTGTTMQAAMASGRDSVGVELDRRLEGLLEERAMGVVEPSNSFNGRRISQHAAWVGRMRREGRTLKHLNGRYRFPVMTAQETMVHIPLLERVEKKGEGRFEVTYRSARKRSEPRGPPSS
jgi:DNA modification methylase